MKPYLAFMKCRALSLLQYKQAALASLSTAFFWGIVQVFILEAFYSGSQTEEPMTLMQAITFVWIGQALLPLLPWTLDKEVEAQIKSGNIAYEILRPIDLYWLLFSKGLALRVVPLLFRTIPLVLASAIFFDLLKFASLESCCFFVLSVLLGALLSAAMTTLVMVSLFWTQSGEGIEKILPHAALFLSGVRIPLPLFPDWLQPFFNIQPFRGILDIPCRLYTGVILPSEALYYLSFQLAWILIFVFLGKTLMRKAQKTLSIQGG